MKIRQKIEDEEMYACIHLYKHIWKRVHVSECTSMQVCMQVHDEYQGHRVAHVCRTYNMQHVTCNI